MTKTRDSGVFDTSIIDGRLPIGNEEKLETFGKTNYDLAIYT